MLVQQRVKEHDVLLQLQPCVVCSKELTVLLLQLLPDKGCESWLNLGLMLESAHDLLLIHVQLQASLNQILHQLNVLAGDLSALASCRRGIGR